MFTFFKTAKSAVNDLRVSAQVVSGTSKAVVETMRDIQDVAHFIKLSETAKLCMGVMGLILLLIIACK